MQEKCRLCNSDSKYIFNWGKYKIFQCKKCKTSFVQNMPTKEELDNFYNGFKYCVGYDKSVIVNENFKNWYKSFNFPQNAKMLDIGGGNGFYSLAFEQFGFGKATYIDLDKKACEYVKSLGVSSVINDDLCNISNYTNDKFDFIYSRHVIEHLINPLELIDNAISLLSDNGVFILQCPNGLSHERLLDTKYMANIAKNIEESNRINKLQLLNLILSDKLSADIAPPRHLWAFSPKGLESYLKTKNVDFKIKTYSSRDPIYSPYIYDDACKYKKNKL